MHVRLLAALLLVASFLLPASVQPAAAEGCQYALGFKALHDLLPATVGDCLVNEHHNAENGDGLQETTGKEGKGGLLVWRKSDNWTAFTDGYRAWINGPRGVQTRLNGERFSWEGDSAAFSRAAEGDATPATTLVVGGGAVTTDALTVRGGPGAHNPAVGTLQGNTPLRLLAGPAGDGWWRVTGGGLVGYVGGAWLKSAPAPDEPAAFDVDLPLTFHRQMTSVWCDPADLQSWIEYSTGKSLGSDTAIQQSLWDYELAHNAGFIVEQWNASPYAIAAAAHQWLPDRGFNHFAYDDPLRAMSTVAWLIANPAYREPAIVNIWRGDHYIVVRGVRATADPFKEYPRAKILGVYVMDPNQGRPSWLGEDRYIPIAEWVGQHFTPVSYLTPHSGVPGDPWQGKYAVVQRDWTNDGPTPGGRVNASPESYAH
jgi:hypothetical protein